MALKSGWMVFALTGGLFMWSGWEAWGGSGWIDDSDAKLRFSSLAFWAISFGILWISSLRRATHLTKEG
ncbi:hypothetical protein WK77_16155 [Burkholderia ubonensis]|nr:hypothetical protein WK77_16155 [Burkholderia ubonensis]